MIKAIIFDFDGVIVESVDIKTKAFAKLFENQGKDIVKRVVDYHINNTGVSRYEKFKYIYKNILRTTLSNEKFQKLCKEFADLVITEVVNASYVKGANEFLEQHAKNYMCFVCSATPQDEMRKIIKQRGIDSFFKAIYGAPMEKKDIVGDIITKENINPKNVVYIGDALSDYKASYNNSVTFIARITDNNKKLFAKIDCLKINDLTTLFNIIKNHKLFSYRD